MIPRFITIVFFLLISFSCKKNELVVITGTITDEITGNPIEGASVSLKLDYQYDGAHNSFILDETTTTTGSDGSYKINIDSDYSIRASTTTWPFPRFYNVYASAPGFAGSNLHPVTAEKRQVIDAKLHKYAQLNIHAKNAGLYNKKQGYIWLDRSLPLAPMEFTEYHFYCSGPNFDSTIVIKNIWANVEYSYGFSQGYDFMAVKSSYGSIIAKPDVINDFYLTF